jgi:hypothetical protein
MEDINGILTNVIAGLIVAVIGAATLFLAKWTIFQKRLFDYVRQLPDAYAFEKFSLARTASYYDYPSFGSLEDLIKGSEISLVTGEAGIGKTSFLLNRLEHYCLQTRWWAIAFTRVPIVVRTNSLQRHLHESPHDTLVEIVGAALREAGLVEFSPKQVSMISKMLLKGRFVFIADDLDQMSPDCLGKLAQILRVRSRSSRNRFLLGCRIAFYEQALRDEWRDRGIEPSIEQIHLEPMTQKQLWEFRQSVAQTMQSMGYLDAAARLPVLLENPELATLCRQPFYLSLLLKLLEDGVQIDTTLVSPFYLLDEACRHLIYHPGETISQDIREPRPECYEPFDLFPLIGCLAYNGVLPGDFSKDRPAFRQKISEALCYLDLHKCTDSASDLGEFITNCGIVTAAPGDRPNATHIGFVHGLFKDYFISWFCRDDTTRLLDYIGDNEDRGRYLVPFWAATSESRALVHFVEAAKEAHPFLVALCLQEKQKLERDIRTTVADLSARYVCAESYNPQIAEQYCRFICDEHADGRSERLRTLETDMVRLLRDEAQQRRSETRSAEDSASQRFPVGEDLFRCMVLAIDNETARRVVPLALEFEHLRLYGSLAPEEFLTVLEDMLYRDIDTGGESLARIRDKTDSDILDAIVAVDTVSAFELACKLLHQDNLADTVAAAIAPIFGSSDALRRGFDSDCGRDTEETDTSFGWIWRPFIRGKISTHLAANTTRFIRVLLNNLDRPCMEGRTVESRIGTGLLAIQEGADLYDRLRADSLLKLDVEKLAFGGADVGGGGDDPREELLNRVKSSSPRYYALAKHVNGQIPLEIAWRMLLLDARPNPDLWGEHIVAGTDLSLSGTEEYRSILTINQIGLGLACVSLAGGLLLTGGWFVAFLLAFYLVLSWFAFARNPIALVEQGSLATAELPPHAVPLVNFPFIIVNALLSRAFILIIFLRSMLGRGEPSEAWLDVGTYVSVWATSVALSVWYGLGSIVPSLWAPGIPALLVGVGLMLQFRLFARAWRRLVSFDSPYAHLLDARGNVVSIFR